MAAMPFPPADGSRDLRTDDVTNVWLIHPLGRLLLPTALRWRLPANFVSLAGLALGLASALAYFRWLDAGFATLGFVLAVAWLVADGLDGMIARATGTASAFGRFLDGICDHSVFFALYVSLAASIGTAQAWTLAVVAGAVHAVQATLFEGERMRFHRRIKGDAGGAPLLRGRNILVRTYDAVAGSLDRLAAPFDQCLAASAQPQRLAAEYRERATPPLRLMSLLSNNMRVAAVYAACLVGDPSLFWWAELILLSLVALVGIAWHRRAERHAIGSERSGDAPRPTVISR